MLTAPKPRSRNRRTAASMMASRDPPRRALGTEASEPLRASMQNPHLHCFVQITILHHIMHSKVGLRGKRCPALAGRTPGHRPCERQCQCSSPASWRPPWPPRPSRAATRVCHPSEGAVATRQSEPYDKAHVVRHYFPEATVNINPTLLS